LTVAARLFGLLAIILGLAYAVEGANWLLSLASGATDRSLLWAHYQVAVMGLDFFIGVASALSGLGVVLLREWGRKCWLALLPLTLFLHAVTMLSQRFAGIDARRVYGWVGMVFVVAVLSWAYLTRPRVKARFR
jgi:hypothetical protein